jgi:hypothetical protein
LGQPLWKACWAKPWACGFAGGQTYRGIPNADVSSCVSLERGFEQQRVWEDVLRVMERLAMPIGEKQRRFFFKGSKLGRRYSVTISGQRCPCPQALV